MSRLEYRVEIEPLAPEDGGGFLAVVPDLPGCMSDGDTPEAVNVQDAIQTWIQQPATLVTPFRNLRAVSH